MSSPIQFLLNDRAVALSGVSPNLTLLQWLRGQPELRGTKEGCAEGDCGACTVVFVDVGDDGPRFRAVNACLVLMPMCAGRQIYTVEALRRDEAYHPVQVAMVEELGSQCGYCTPGVVMTLFEAAYRTDLDAPWKLDDQLCGNLCRCTGYRPIKTAAERTAGACPQDHFGAVLGVAQPADVAIDYTAGDLSFSAPATPEALWDAMDAHPDATLICGGTDLSLAITRRFETLPHLISVEAVAGLQELTIDDDAVTIGAAVSLARIEESLSDVLPSLHRMLRYFASRQIKNRGTLGGNLCNASPIGDTPPALLALGTEVELWSRAGRRWVALDDFFLAYRKTALQPGEILGRVRIRRPPDAALRATYKVSKRRELDISAVAAGFYVERDAAGIVTVARLAYGGMAATPKRASNAEAALVGQSWSEATVEAAAQAIASDFTPLDDHRSSAWYRSEVAANLLRGFYVETQQHGPAPTLPYGHSGTVLAEVAP